MEMSLLTASDALSSKAQLDKCEDPSRIHDILSMLSKGRITYAILKSTKIGVTVAKFRKHSDQQVAEKAKMILNMWKRIAAAEGPGTPRSALLLSSGTPRSPQMGHKVVASSAFPGISQNGGQRGKVRAKLEGILSKDTQTSHSEIVRIVQTIEEAMHLKFKADMQGYKQKYMKLVFNLKKNAPLRGNVLRQSVSAQALVEMSSEELQTEELKEKLKKVQDDIDNERRLDWGEANAEELNAQADCLKGAQGLFECGKCHSRKTTNYQKQTRSADEPMTVFVSCLNCRNRWRC